MKAWTFFEVRDEARLWFSTLYRAEADTHAARLAGRHRRPFSVFPVRACLPDGVAGPTRSAA